MTPEFMREPFMVSSCVLPVCRPNVRGIDDGGLVVETYRDEVSDVAKVRHMAMLFKFCSSKPEHLLPHVDIRDGSCAADYILP